jgi:hypothetical protein
MSCDYRQDSLRSALQTQPLTKPNTLIFPTKYFYAPLGVSGAFTLGAAAQHTITYAFLTINTLCPRFGVSGFFTDLPRSESPGHSSV